MSRLAGQARFDDMCRVRGELSRSARFDNTGSTAELPDAFNIDYQMRNTGSTNHSFRPSGVL